MVESEIKKDVKKRFLVGDSMGWTPGGSKEEEFEFLSIENYRAFFVF